MKTYTSIIFDLDDTLWDTKQNSKDSLHEIFDKYHLDRFYENYDDFYIVFLTLNESLWEQYNHGRISKEELQNTRFRQILSRYTNDLDFYKMNSDFIENTCTKTKLIEGAHEMLKYLSSKYKLAILSNSFERALRSKIESSNFTQYFEQIYSSEIIRINKPDPKAFEYVINGIGGDKSRSVMIGDNLSTDILGARNSGIDQIWFNKEKMDVESEVHPTHIITSLFELESIL